MTVDNSFERVKDPADPRRCQGSSKGSQCTIVAVEGSKYCKMHGGASVANKAKRDELRNLKLSKFKARLVQLGNSTDIMSLRDEIAITRMTLEELINSCEGPSDLITFSGQISAMVNNVGKLVKDCHSIEEKTGHLLGRDALMQFAGNVIDIIIKHVADENIRRAIAADIVEAAAETK
jgi:hypothetical protein